jgi:hypothetical protein
MQFRDAGDSPNGIAEDTTILECYIVANGE